MPALDRAFGGIAVLLALHQAIPRRLDGARLQNLLRIASGADPSAGDGIETDHVRHRAQTDPLGFMVLEWASREPRQPSGEMDREYVERILSSPTSDRARRAIGELKAARLQEQRAAVLAEEEERVRVFKAEQERLQQRRRVARSTP